MLDSAAVSIQNLHKFYGPVHALRGVDLQVRRGEIFGFLGPNGAGKTTTIRCLLDLIRPNDGELWVLGIDPQKDPVSVRARCGYLPGELHFDQNMSVEGILRYFNRLRRGVATWDRIQALTGRLDLNLKAVIKNLSKGNKQKVGIVQALMHQPELLLLDEPTSGLDPLVQQEVLHMVREAREAGATVFFSSHQLNEVQGLSDRVAIIRSGKVVEISDTKALIERSFRRARIQFRHPVDTTALEQVPGVKLVSHQNGSALLQVEGEMDALIKALAAYPVLDFETERPTLEEIFLAYYDEEKTA